MTDHSDLPLNNASTGAQCIGICKYTTNQPHEMDAAVPVLGPRESLEQRWFGVESLLLNGNVNANDILVSEQAQLVSDRKMAAH